jgi:hypothetical protein
LLNGRRQRLSPPTLVVTRGGNGRRGRFGAMSDEFWDVAAPLLAEGVIDQGTIMGGPCVRAGGEFVGMPSHQGPGLVVKLHRDRVAELIDGGTGQAFAPAGKVFKEWVLVEDFDESTWEALIRESVGFVTG